METLNFEAIKISMKQDKEGYVLTLRIHPDEVPEDLFRDFVGARYQTVMVRLGDNDKPMERVGKDLVRLSGILCREEQFGKFLQSEYLLDNASEEMVIEWLRCELGIESRSELLTNIQARSRFIAINNEYKEWKQNA